MFCMQQHHHPGVESRHSYQDHNCRSYPEELCEVQKCRKEVEGGFCMNILILVDLVCFLRDVMTDNLIGNNAILHCPFGF